MPASYVFKKMIREEMKKLSNPVKIEVFIDRNNNSQNYDYTMSILRDYQENSNGMLTIEEFHIGENPAIDKKYKIQRVPTILFINKKGIELIRYLSAPQGSEIQPFVQSLLIFAGAPNYYREVIRENLNRIKPSTIKVMTTNSCAYCPQIISIVSQFALASEGKIKAVIIDIMENPDIGEKYDTSSVPFTIINDNEPFYGIYGADELIKQLIDDKIEI
ncbi:MAG: thioredoxin family protein [Promethearchaeota archaeon]